MSIFGFERTASNFKSKRHEGSVNELVDYSRAPCLGADQKARGLWERDCYLSGSFSNKQKGELNRKTLVCLQPVFTLRVS